jgi:hypothetical protein
MDIKGLAQKIGLIGATVGAGALSTATGGATAPLTNTILETLGKALDPTAKAQLEAAAAAQQEELQKAEWDHAEKLIALAQADTASARQREMAVKDKVPSRLAYIVIGFTLAYCVAVTFVSSRLDAMMIGTIFGYLISDAKLITGYYFGSSAGSAQKTDLLAKAPAIPPDKGAAK